MLLRWAYNVNDVPVTERLQRNAFRQLEGSTAGK